MTAIKLLGKTIEKESSDHFLILEAGTNHYEFADYEGISPYDAAHKMIEKAKYLCHAIKFQAYNADKTASSIYASNQYKYMRRRDSMIIDEYKELIKFGKKIGTRVFFSFFDLEMINALGDEVELFKVASPDITNIPLLEKINEYKKPVILSTAGSELFEINYAIKVLQDCEVVIMYCRAIYPTPDEQLDLGTIKTLNKMFPNNVIGWSSHSTEYRLGITALALGANVLEYHFKINDMIKGGDYPISILANKLRDSLFRFSAIYGNPEFRLIPEENPLRQNGRRGLYAVHSLSAGAKVSVNDFIALRPATIKGLDVVPANEKIRINCRIKEAIIKGEPLLKSNLEAIND
ncbi:MAG: N-acetylneuraminate synthase family protein [Promethearchaeota archaeon]|jgi:sialic acid synthase SpsE